jgi:chromate reductase, NAD(P)H dehydrogenase (quinone)
VLLVSGSLRAGSTNIAVLRTARTVAPPDMHCVLYDGLGVLPHFNPDNDADPLPPEVAELRARVHRADALVICTPEYAGALPGSLKNLLEWLIGDDHPRSIYRKPVAWINASPRGAKDTHDALRRVLGYAHATILDDVSAEVPVAASLIGANGEIHDQGPRAQIAHVMGRLRDSLGRGTRE